MVTRLKNRQVGDTSSIEFKLADMRNGGRAFAVTADSDYWLTMTARNGVPKINKRELVADTDATSVFFSPLVADVDTPGIYKIEVFAVDGESGEQFAFAPMQIEIEENIAPLDFSTGP